MRACKYWNIIWILISLYCIFIFTCPLFIVLIFFYLTSWSTTQIIIGRWIGYGTHLTPCVLNVMYLGVEPRMFVAALGDLAHWAKPASLILFLIQYHLIYSIISLCSYSIWKLVIYLYCFLRLFQILWGLKAATIRR